MSSDDSNLSDSAQASTSGKQKIKKRKYNQQYKIEWEKEFETWLAAGKSKTEAYCKVCNKSISVSSGKLQLIRHQDSEAHQKKIKSINKQQTLSSFMTIRPKDMTSLETSLKKADCYISAFVAEHNLSFRVVDHLPSLITKICPDSEIAKKIQCGRTKTTAIVKNVIGQSASSNICAILRSSKFSLIIDESTDLSTKKHLVMVARYFYKNKIHDTFLSLIEVKSSKAEDIYKAIVNFFEEKRIPYLQNLIGFASDGANVMTGVHDSVMSRLKRDIPHIFLMTCICHSFALCASNACLKLPTAVEDCVRSIYNYIGNSPKRVEILKEFQNFTQTKIHKILHPAQTRWLSLEAVVCRVIEQYNALKLYFIDAVSNDRMQSADKILNTLQDPLTLAFLLFLEHILPLFNALSKEMQSSEPKLYNLHSRLNNLYKTLLDYFIKKNILNASISPHKINVKNPDNYKPIENVYLGAKTTQYILKQNLSPEKINIVRVRCLDFYIEAALQISKRYDFDNIVLKSMSLINPKCIFEGNEESIVPLIMHFPNLCAENDIQKIDNEWRILKNSEFSKTFNADQSITSFWLNVQAEKYADGSLVFPLVTDFALNMLSLPHSSADAERKFSQTNLMKTKQRNLLSTNSIVGLMHSKEYIGSSECFNLHIDQQLLSYHNNNMYKRSENFSDSE